jgi:hypothetical protein
MKEFVISDETFNSHGCSILTSGIDLKRFRKNPVMYYNHNYGSHGVIGKWDNLRVQGKQLIATPVFDTNDETGAKISQKVENGFIKAASIGVSDCIFETIQGKEWIVSCTLFECSVCDIPSNENALILYHNGKPVKSKEEYKKLCINNKQKIMNKDDFKKILEALGLNPDDSIDDVLSVISALIGEETPEQVVENCIKLGYLNDYERAELLEMAHDSQNVFRKYITKRKEKALLNIEQRYLDIYKINFNKLRVFPYSFVMGEMKEFAMSNFNVFSKMVELMPELQKLSDWINTKPKRGQSENRSEWTLDDYRKKAPMELRNNPELYERLLEKEYKNK